MSNVVGTASIVFDADASNVKMSAKEMASAIASLKQSVSQTDKGLRSSFSGYSAAISKNVKTTRDFNRELRSLEAQASKIRSAISSGSKEESVAFGINKKAIKKAEDNVDRLSNSLDMLNNKKGAQGETSLAKMQKDAEALDKRIKSLKSERDYLQGKQVSTGDPSGGFAKQLKSVNAELKSAVSERKDLTQKMDDATKLDTNIEDTTRQLSAQQKELKALYEERDKLLSSGKAYDDGGLAKNQENLKALEDRIRQMKAAIAETPSARQGLAASIGEDVKKAEAHLAEFQKKRDELNSKQNDIGVRAFGSQEAFDRVWQSVEEGSTEARQKLSEALTNIGATDEWNANAAAIRDYDAEIDRTTVDIARMRGEMADISNMPIDSIDMSNVEEVDAAIRQSEENLNNLYDVREKLQGADADVKSASIQELTAQIAATKQEAQELRAEEQRLKDAGENMPTEAYQKTAQELESAKSELAGFKAQEESLRGQGADVAAQNVQNLQAQYDSALEALNQLNDKQSELTAAGDYTGAAAMGEAIEQAEDRLSDLGDKLADLRTSGVSDLADQWNNCQDAISTATDKVVLCTEKMDALSANGENFGTDAWEDTQDAIRETEADLQEYESELESVKGNGGEELATSWDSNEAAINREIERLGELKEAKQELQSTTQGTSASGIDTSGAEAGLSRMSMYMDSYMKKWQQMATLSGMVGNAAAAALTPMVHPIQAADRALGTLISRVGQAISSFARMAGNGAISFLKRLASEARNAAVQLAKLAANAVSGGFKKIASGAVAAAKGLLNFNRSHGRTNNGLKIGLKTLLKYAFGVRSMFFLFRRLRSAVIEGLGEIGKQNPAVKAALDGLSGSLNGLKASLATAFAPILTAIAPVLITLINLLTAAANAIGAFFAALGGGSTFSKAITGITGIGKAAGGAGGAVDKLKRKLAGFDELNIVKSDSEGGGGGGGGGKGSAYKYEQSPIPEDILDFATKIREYWLNGEYEKIGELVGQKINAALERIYKAVQWKNVFRKWQKALDAFAGIFNGLVKSINWPLIIRTIREGIKTLLKAAEYLLSNISFKDAGAALASALNELFGDTEMWATIQGVIEGAIGGAIDFVKAFMDNLHEGEIAKQIREALENRIDWGNIATEVWGVITTAFNKAGNFMNVLLGGEDHGGGKTSPKNLKKPLAHGRHAGEIGDTFDDRLAGGYPEPSSYDKVWDELADNFAQGANRFIAKATEVIEGLNPAGVLNGFLQWTAKIRSGINFNGLGAFIGASFKLALDTIETIIYNFRVNAPQMGTDLAAAINAIINAAFSGTTISDIFTNAVIGVFKLGEAFVAALDAEGAADAIRKAVEDVPWGEIADAAWGFFTTALSKAGDFLTVLLGGQVSMPDDVVEAHPMLEANQDTRSFGALLGGAISDALVNGLGAIKTFFETLPWETWGTNLSDALNAIDWGECGQKLADALQTLFNKLMEFADGLFGVEPGNESKGVGAAGIIGAVSGIGFIKTLGGAGKAALGAGAGSALAEGGLASLAGAASTLSTAIGPFVTAVTAIGSAGYITGAKAWDEFSKNNAELLADIDSLVSEGIVEFKESHALEPEKTYEGSGDPIKDFLTYLFGGTRALENLSGETPDTTTVDEFTGALSEATSTLKEVGEPEPKSEYNTGNVIADLAAYYADGNAILPSAQETTTLEAEFAAGVADMIAQSDAQGSKIVDAVNETTAAVKENGPESGSAQPDYSTQSGAELAQRAVELIGSGLAKSDVLKQFAEGGLPQEKVDALSAALDHVKDTVFGPTEDADFASLVDAIDALSMTKEQQDAWDRIEKTGQGASEIYDKNGELYSAATGQSVAEMFAEAAAGIVESEAALGGAIESYTAAIVDDTEEPQEPEDIADDILRSLLVPEMPEERADIITDEQRTALGEAIQSAFTGAMDFILGGGGPASAEEETRSYDALISEAKGLVDMGFKPDIVIAELAKTEAEVVALTNALTDNVTATDDNTTAIEANQPQGPEGGQPTGQATFPSVEEVQAWYAENGSTAKQKKATEDFTSAAKRETKEVKRNTKEVRKNTKKRAEVDVNYEGAGFDTSGDKPRLNVELAVAPPGEEPDENEDGSGILGWIQKILGPGVTTTVKLLKGWKDFVAALFPGGVPDIKTAVSFALEGVDNVLALLGVDSKNPIRVAIAAFREKLNPDADKLVDEDGKDYNVDVNAKEGSKSEPGAKNLLALAGQSLIAWLIANVKGGEADEKGKNILALAGESLIAWVIANVKGGETDDKGKSILALATESLIAWVVANVKGGDIDDDGKNILALAAQNLIAWVVANVKGGTIDDNGKSILALAGESLIAWVTANVKGGDVDDSGKSILALAGEKMIAWVTANVKGGSVDDSGKSILALAGEKLVAWVTANVKGGDIDSEGKNILALAGEKMIAWVTANVKGGDISDEAQAILGLTKEQIAAIITANLLSGDVDPEAKKYLEWAKDPHAVDVDVNLTEGDVDDGAKEILGAEDKDVDIDINANAKASGDVEKVKGLVSIVGGTVNRDINVNTNKGGNLSVQDTKDLNGITSKTETINVTGNVNKIGSMSIADAEKIGKITSTTATQTVTADINKKGNLSIDDANKASQIPNNKATDTITVNANKKGKLSLAEAEKAGNIKSNTANVNVNYTGKKSGSLGVDDAVKLGKVKNGNIKSEISVTVKAKYKDSKSQSILHDLRDRRGFATGGAISRTGHVTRFEMGGIISRLGNYFRFANGGQIMRNGRASWYDSVNKYADGTARARGTVFVAGEAGPEIMGHINGRTEILNKSQLADAIYAAVVSGMGQAVNALGSYLANHMTNCTNSIVKTIAANTGWVDVGNIEYHEPVMASGGIMPYDITMQIARSTQEIQSTLDANNEDLIQAMVSAIGSAAQSIVQAMLTQQTRNVPTNNGMTSRQMIDAINRSTLMFGQSPLKGV